MCYTTHAMRHVNRQQASSKSEAGEGGALGFAGPAGPAEQEGSDVSSV
jgi:hypothetical protein